MVRDAYYYAFGAVVAAVLVGWLATPAWAVVPAAAGAFFVWFFRDPERHTPSAPGTIVSAADGKVTHIGQVQIDGRPRTRISVFLSVFNVHVNRSPIAGVVRKVDYRRGRFLNALRAESAEVNEQNTVTIEGEGQTVVFKQIAGVLARRIVFTKKPSDVVARGERIGMIKFGSRTDVIFDADADVRVKIGDHARGGETVLAVARAAVAPARVAAGGRHAPGGES